MWHATHREREREKSKNRLFGHHSKQTWRHSKTKRKMSHYNFTDIILPRFIKLPIQFIFVLPRCAALSFYVLHVPHNHCYPSGTASSLRPVLSSLLSKPTTAILLTILCLLRWLILLVSFGVGLLVCTGLFSGCCCSSSFAVMSAFVRAVSPSQS
jgi:hypothetical protein